ncbi:MAG TPA: phytanoyl-CoA dioxygenase family protein [Chthonomonadaceae bacterium]|nr:phytanoyl-CoA dioxygenase family protein [Chthonomonadaceae bacterium]
MLSPEEANRKRQQLIEEGYCIVEEVLSAEFLEELRQTTDAMLDSVEHPPHWKYQGSDLHVRSGDHPAIARLIGWQPSRDALEALGLGDFKTRDSVIVLSKPPGGHALYWHQDWTGWNDPISAAPWVQYVFLSYYLVDTTPENGCLQVIPGTHRKRIPLHEKLTPAHAEGGYYVPEDDPDMFCEHPDAVDVPVKAGALVIAEGRLLHAARANRSDQRRTLLLIWHDRPATVPAYWDGEIPEVIRQRDPNGAYPSTRIPGIYLPG